MGAMIELNTLVRLSPDFDFTTLKNGLHIEIELQRERIFPLRIALLYFHSDWNFLGYCRVLSTKQSDGKTCAKVEILTVFTQEEQTLYKQKFIEAGKFTGEA